jgi:hypothetical protein
LLRPKGKSLSILKTNTVTEFYSHLITLAHHSILTHRNLEVLKIGHWALGMGHWALGMGHGALGMGHGAWGIGYGALGMGHGAWGKI